MSAQVIGAKRATRLNRMANEWLVANHQTPVLFARAWSHGHPAWHAFVTEQHRHGYVNLHTGEVEWEDDNGRHPVRHYTSCHTLFPYWNH